jgi:hypothetical protein
MPLRPGCSSSYRPSSNLSLLEPGVMYLQGEDEERWADLTAVRAQAAYVAKAIRQSARSR